MSPSFVRRIAMAVALIWLGGCRGEPEGTPAPAPVSAAASAPSAATRVLAAGCRVFRLPDRCEVGDEDKLRLFAPGVTPAGAPDVRLDDVPVTAAWEVIPEGTRLWLPPGSRGRLTARAGDRLLLDWQVVAHVPDASVEEIRGLHRGGKAEEARTRLAAALPGATGERRALLLGLQGQMQRGAGAHEAAVESLREAAELHRGVGRLSDFARDSGALAYTLAYHLRRFDEARAALAALDAAAAPLPEAGAVGPYFRAQIAFETGDVRGVLSESTTVAALAGPLALEEWLLSNAQNQAQALLSIGRADDAAAALEPFRRVAMEAATCNHLMLLNNLAWAALSRGRLDEARTLQSHALERASAVCPGGQVEAEVAMDLALVALREGDAAGAHEALERARAALPAPAGRVALDLLWIASEVAAARGRSDEAMQGFERLTGLSRAAGLPGLGWRAAVGRARVMLTGRAPKPEVALLAYREAETLLDEQLRAVPMTEGRERMVSDREAATREHLSLLYELGRHEEAERLVRADRVRVLAGLTHGARVAGLSSERRARFEAAVTAWRAERSRLDGEAADDWSLRPSALTVVQRKRAERVASLRATLDRAYAETGEVPNAPAGGPPPDGHLRMVFHPLPDGWVALARGKEGLRAAKIRLPALDDRAALAAALFSPFREALARARTLDILPYGPLRAVDFHALPIDAAPLVTRWTVRYPLDLAVETAPSIAGPAVLVADPRNDLPAARSEAALVAQALASPPGSLERLEGDAATGEAVRRLLPGARWLHYAGHGHFSGRGGWDSVLPLAGETDLSVPDILTLRPGPAVVVLSGCETARQDLASEVEGVGLAQAFLLAGSREVLAATRVVDDRLAADLMRRVYSHATGSPGSLAEALRQAQMALLDTSGDWPAFRVFTHTGEE